MATNTRESGVPGGGCGLGVSGVVQHALGGLCTRLVTSAEQEEGWREGRRGRHIVRMRRKGAEFEALGLPRTFVGGPAAAQWAVAGEAPASQLIDRSQPRPQRGNGPERMTPANRI